MRAAFVALMQCAVQESTWARTQAFLVNLTCTNVVHDIVATATQRNKTRSSRTHQRHHFAWCVEWCRHIANSLFTQMWKFWMPRGLWKACLCPSAKAWCPPCSPSFRHVPSVEKISRPLLHPKWHRMFGVDSLTHSQFVPPLVCHKCERSSYLASTVRPHFHFPALMM